jgi:hypothetical protein
MEIMKKQILKNVATIVRRTYIQSAFVLVLGSSFSTAKAQSADSVPPAGEVKYLGSLNNQQLLFQLEFDNKANETFYVTIKDQDGYVFYQQSFKDKKLVKKFLFEKTDNENANLIFSVSTQKGKQTQSFQVDTRMVERTEVTKL